MEYIKRFRDIALDCYDHCEERMLVEMCMTNMIREFRVVLENLEISQFAQLLQKARKTAQSVKPSSDKRNRLWPCPLETREEEQRGGSMIHLHPYHALLRSWKCYLTSG